MHLHIETQKRKENKEIVEAENFKTKQSINALM
jgi:hypothetical protein